MLLITISDTDSSNTRRVNFRLDGEDCGTFETRVFYISGGYRDEAEFIGKMASFLLHSRVSPAKVRKKSSKRKAAK